MNKDLSYRNPGKSPWSKTKNSETALKKWEGFLCTKAANQTISEDQKLPVKGGKPIQREILEVFSF